MNGDNKTLDVFEKILVKNDAKAGQNREYFDSLGLLAINLMSSPGAGKTTLLEAIIKNTDFKLAVIEGDLETNQDANRIIKAGAEAHQVSTGQTCHLDAFMVYEGLGHINIQGIDLLFVENIGNLVCPASYDLGTHLNIVLLSIPEGDDKVSKYPVMFKKADVLIVSKTSLKPYFNFDYDRVIKEARKLNPAVRIFFIDSISSEGLHEFCDYLREQRIRYVS